MCLSPTALDVPSGGVGVTFSCLSQLCCGKRLCGACRADANYGYALDLLGESRCTFCNALRSGGISLSLQEATAGKAWAQYNNGRIHYDYLEPPDTSKGFDYLVKAASQGHPEAFLKFSALCRLGQCGYPRDLVAAQAFAKKARSLHPHLRLISNKALFDIAKQYLGDGDVEEVMGIFSDIAKEVDPDALDGILCQSIAAAAFKIEQYQLAGEMSVKTFWHGAVESALSASFCYSLSKHYALSKLWLSVACKTKFGYDYAIEKLYGAVGQRGWSFFKQRRDEIRSKLREIRDSCGGCGDALEGDARKYCRGCKAFCYCSRECQKLHWNRADANGGHSTECKEAQDQARKILEAIQSGKVDLSIEEK